MTTAPTLLDVLSVAEIGKDTFRANFVQPDPRSLFGGQVLAQGLLAAGRTVPPGWLPHSLHAYFLRAGDSLRPTTYEVLRDRDGRSFAARRVLAHQGGEVICSLAVSLSNGPGRGPERQALPVPDLPAIEELPTVPAGRVLGFEIRGDQVPEEDATTWPSRFWIRTKEPLGDDPVVHAAALTYWSDNYTGISPMAEPGERPGQSLDHAVWFHRPVRMDAWAWTDLVPVTASVGRGFYTGAFWQGGLQVASIAQESLFRPPAS